MINKKDIHIDLSKLERSEIDKVYEFLKSKGERIACNYSGCKELAWSANMNGWNDFKESYTKEISLGDFYKLFKRPILFAYFIA